MVLVCAEKQTSVEHQMCDCDTLERMIITLLGMVNQALTGRLHAPGRN